MPASPHGKEFIEKKGKAWGLLPLPELRLWKDLAKGNKQ